MFKARQLVFACMILVMPVTVVAQEPDSTAQRAQQVQDTERAFAATMAERDFDAFTSFLSDEAIFFSGKTQLRGKQQIADAWKPYFEEAAAPFSWEPDTVAVLDSGGLALSSGPVFGSDGKQIGKFNSTWRLHADGKWRIIFDKGNEACNCPKP